MEPSVEHVFSVEAMVHGNHGYKNAWDAPNSEMLRCEREVGSIHDTFAVAIKKDGEVVCHCPRKVSALDVSFNSRSG